MKGRSVISRLEERFSTFHGTWGSFHHLRTSREAWGQESQPKVEPGTFAMQNRVFLRLPQPAPLPTSNYSSAQWQASLLFQLLHKEFLFLQLETSHLWKCHNNFLEINLKYPEVAFPYSASSVANTHKQCLMNGYESVQACEWMTTLKKQADDSIFITLYQIQWIQSHYEVPTNSQSTNTSKELATVVLTPFLLQPSEILSS